MDLIYLDNAATTRILPAVLNEMMPFLEGFYGNPSSSYSLARSSRKAINTSRDKVSKFLNAKSNEIYFTSSGSESNNQIIKTIANMNTGKGRHIITSAIEHPAVLNTMKWLEKNGYSITILPVNENGLIDPESLKRTIKKETILVSIMYANNEVGTIQDIKTLSSISHECGAFFHTDAVQAIGNINVNVDKLGVDALSLSAHKFYGPKGIGALYVRNGVPFDSYIHGGNQERSKRAGTENVAGIVGLGKAIELSYESCIEYSKIYNQFKEEIINKIVNQFPDIYINGDTKNRLSNNLNLYIKGVSNSQLVTRLDMDNVFISGGSACHSGSSNPSHVLMAMYNDSDRANNSIRITFGKYNTQKEIEVFIEKLQSLIIELRK